MLGQVIKSNYPANIDNSSAIYHVHPSTTDSVAPLGYGNPVLNTQIEHVWNAVDVRTHAAREDGVSPLCC